MSRLPFLLTTSAAVAFASCKTDSETCGIGDATTTIAATGAGLTFTYGSLMGGANNDCPDPNAPEGVVSITIQAQQTDGTGFMTLCIPRIDELEQSGGVIGGTTTGDVRVVDVDGMSSGCSITAASGMMASGTASAAGVCSNGTDPAGFALTLDAMIPVEKTCAGVVQVTTLTLSGTVAVLPQ